MIEWLEKLFKKIFFKNKMKLLEEPKVIKKLEDIKNDFFVKLKRQVELEVDDGNGYKLIQNIKLEDMV